MNFISPCPMSSLPYERMDICLFGKNNGLPMGEVAQGAGLTLEQVQRVYNDIETKRKTTRYLQLSPILLGRVPEISSSW